MEHGLAEHEIISALEKRRLLKHYGLNQGERFFHVPLSSTKLGLSGLLDLLIVTDRYYPVEFKETLGPISINHKAQLTGYALLVEETYETRVETGFVYRIPTHQVTVVPITASLRRKVLEDLQAINEMLKTEQMPPPTPQRGKCIDCEFRNFCGDVL